MMFNEVGLFIVPNGNVYKILDTGVPYKIGYPDVVDGAERMTENTGFKVVKETGLGLWSYVCTTRLLENAKKTICRISHLPSDTNIDLFKIEKPTGRLLTKAN